MKYEQKGTLAYYESAPHLKQLSLVDVPLENISASYTAYNKTAGEVLPDSEAVKFYALNHLASMVKAKFTKNEPLPAWAVKVMDAYTAQLSAQGSRMFYYMLIICTRESRHAMQKDEWNLSEKTSSKYYAWWKQIKGSGSSGTANKFINEPPKIPLGDYTRFMMLAFDGMHFSGGYGGPKWGEIARTLHRFVKGEFSLEMLVDTAYTLSHNNGPIFNKGFLYTMYSDEIMKILDIQRAGQVLEYVMASHGSVSSTAIVPDALYEIVKEVHDLFPEEFGTYVDYYTVEKLGALKKYTAEKKKQDQEHGKPDWVKDNEPIGWWSVDTTTQVQIVKSHRAAKKTAVPA